MQRQDKPEFSELDGDRSPVVAGFVVHIPLAAWPSLKEAVTKTGARIIFSKLSVGKLYICDEAPPGVRP